MQPRISIIVPVYNDAEGLETTLESLANQDYSKEYEILPVDNNSSDNTGDIIREFEDEYPELVRGCEELDVQSSYAARNTGVEHAEGEILVFTDADMWWDKDVLSIVDREFSETDVDYIGARVELVKEKDNIASLLGMNDFGNEEFCLENYDYVPTAFMAVKSSVVSSVGGFDERMTTGADRLFGKKVKKQGYNQSFSHEISVYHPVRDNWRDYVKRTEKYGRSIYQTEKYNKEYLESSRKHPLSWKNLVPTLPWRLNNLEFGKEKLSPKEFVGVYFLYWLDKLYFIKGYVSAKIKDLVG